MNSISIKLFLALFGLTAVILFATIGLARWSFNYGFYDYLDSIEKDRLQRVAGRLGNYYQNNGQRWSSNIDEFFDEVIAADLYRPESAPSLATNNEILRTSLNQPLEDQLRQLTNLSTQEEGNFDNSISPPMGGADPNVRPLGGPMGPPPMGPPPMGGLGGNSQDLWQPNSSSLTASLTRENNTRPAQTEQISALHPTLLLDINGNKLAGAEISAELGYFMSQDINVGGAKVGELRAAVSREFQTPLENAFSAQQKLASASIIGLSLLLAALASWLLSRMMLAPIVTLKNGIGELANGDYRHQLDVDRHDELGLLMTDVNKLGSNLQKNRSSRRGWLADISHELRTPVTVISGEIEAMKDGLRKLDMRSIDSLDHEVNRLGHLIDDLYQLSLSDIGGLRYEFTRVDLSDLLRSIIEQQRERIADAGLNLDRIIDQNVWVMADQARLEQLFTNLINNSIAYTDAPGHIRIGARVEGKHVLVEFEDSSPSVDEKNISDIFEPLFREETSRDRRRGGAGLGLAICRNIATAHDASLHAQKSKLGGVKIEIRFLLAKRDGR